MQIHPVHGEFLGIFEEAQIRLCWTHSPVRSTRHQVRAAAPNLCCSSPVVTVQLHHSLLQLAGLAGSEVEVVDVVGAVLFRLIVAELSLNGVGAQKGVGDKGTRKTPRQDVIPQLQTQVVPVDQEITTSILILHKSLFKPRNCFSVPGHER